MKIMIFKNEMYPITRLRFSRRAEGYFETLTPNQKYKGVSLTFFKWYIFVGIKTILREQKVFIFNTRIVWSQPTVVNKELKKPFESVAYPNGKALPPEEFPETITTDWRLVRGCLGLIFVAWCVVLLTVYLLF